MTGVNLDVKTYALTIQHFCASILVDDYELVANLDIEVRHQYRMEMLAHQLVAMLRIPADVLNDDKVIAEWPDGLWQTVRKALGWKHKTRQVRLTEMLLFPGVAVPRPLKPCVYVRHCELPVNPFAAEYQS